MGEALLGGLIRSKWAPPAQLTVVEALAPRRQELAESFPECSVVAEAPAGFPVVMAVKPGDAQAVARALQTGDAVPRLISIMAGVRISQLEDWLGPGVSVIRAMPNVAALVGYSATAISPGSEATEEDMQWAESILGAVGTTVRVNEGLIDAVTGVSGSGPAYLLLVVEAMIEAAVQLGLPRPQATGLVVQTLVGTGKLLELSGATPEALRATVTSPGGTTAAALAALEDRAVRAAMGAAVRAAAERAKELGNRD
jgi:pyrroline-5-carboxylate reductase